MCLLFERERERERELCECKSLSRTPRFTRKRRFDDVDVVEEVQIVKVEKKSSCPFCKVQEGDIDQCQPATAEFGPRRMRLRDGMDDYCYILIVLLYGHLSAKDVRLIVISSDHSLPPSHSVVVVVLREIMLV